MRSVEELIAAKLRDHQDRTNTSNMDLPSWEHCSCRDMDKYTWEDHVAAVLVRDLGLEMR